jgi:hypothetical protein
MTSGGKHAAVSETSGLPNVTGLYRTPDDSQNDLGEHHTDHWQFHYLNSAGQWADIGWGAPYEWQKLERVDGVKEFGIQDPNFPGSTLVMLTEAHADEYIALAGRNDVRGPVKVERRVTAWQRSTVQ